MNLVPKPSPNFTAREVCRTKYRGLQADNEAWAAKYPDRNARVAAFLEAVRFHFGAAVIPHSWVRCAEVNGWAHGSPGSYHKKCLAVDFHVSGFEDEFGIAQVVDWIRKSGLVFRKMVDECDSKGNRWIHISLSDPGVQADDLMQVWKMRDGKYERLDNVETDKGI